MNAVSPICENLWPSVAKPRKNPVSYADGLDWSGREHRITRKYDGEFVGGFRCLIAGVAIVGNAERMRRAAAGVLKAGARWTPDDCASGEEFFVLTDVSHLNGTDVSRWTLRQRWAEVLAIFRRLPSSPSPLRGTPPAFEASKNPPVILAEEFPDGAALARVIEQGGEGICAHGWESPFGADFYAAKHLETFLCEVTGFVDGTQSVTIAKPETGNRRLEMGRVALRGGKIDRVRVGSVLKVEGMGLTPAGRIREPRVCTDTPTSWLVRF